MKSKKLSFRLKESLFSIAIAFIIGFIGFLVFFNYKAQVSLEKAEKERIKSNLNNRVTALTYFLTERKNDLNELSVSRSIISFFENKALGMSMEYGLRASLLSIHREFKYFLVSRKLEGTNIYNRILFVEPSGNVLVDTSLNKSYNFIIDWKKLLIKKRLSPYFFFCNVNNKYELFFSVPYFFKDKYVGQIFVLVNPQSIYKLLTLEGSFIFFKNKEHIIYLNKNEFCKPQDVFFKFPEKIRDENKFLLISKYNQQKKLVISTIIPIKESDYSVVLMSPYNKAIALKVWIYPLSLSLLTILLFTGFFMSQKIHSQNIILKTKLKESTKYQKEIERKNIELQNEIKRRKVLEERVKKSEEKYRSIFENALVGIFQLSIDGTFLEVNPKMASILGFESPEEVADFYKDIKNQLFVDKNESEKLLKRVKKTNSVDNFETRLKKKDGSEFWAALGLKVLRGEDSKATHFEGILIDISDRKNMEEELKKINIHLQEALIRAEEASKSKGEFLANMSHEIRTPMNGIIGTLSLLKETELNDDQRHFCSLALNSANSLLAILNDILDLSKIEAGKLELEELEFDFYELLDNEVGSMAIPAQEKGLELIYYIDPLVPLKVYGDPVRIRQILNNLISNSIKFTHKGEIVIKTNVVLHDKDEVILRISVKDTGIGIPEDKQQKLFEKFTQGEKGIARKYGGTGLGLSISKHLVELMGGEIGFFSEQGKGSEFWFTLPLKIPQGGIKHLEVPERIKGLHILVVDDNITFLKYLITFLNGIGIRAQGETSGVSAISELENASRIKDPYHLIIFDYYLKDMGGDLFSSELESNSKVGNRPILFTVPYYNLKNFLNGSNGNGDFNFLIKPISYRNLISAIEDGVFERQEKTSHLNKSEKDVAISVSKDSPVLVVEDNVVNQEVLKTMLTNMGLNVDVAATGEEALSLLKKKDYRLIFMDIQLPDMDGYEVTKIIRSPSSGVKNSKVSIIALSAHAMKEHRVMAIQSGMNDYISKPVSLQDLKRVIQKWLDFEFTNNKNGDALESDRSYENQLQEIPIFDLNGLMSRLAYNEKLVRKALITFKRVTPSRLEELKQELMKKNVQGIKELAHAMKGSSATVGAERLKVLLEQIERAVLFKDWKFLRKSIDDLFKEFNLFEKELEKGGFLDERDSKDQ